MISISCFRVNKCGIQTGSFSINPGRLYCSTFASKKSFICPKSPARKPSRRKTSPSIILNLKELRSKFEHCEATPNFKHYNIEKKLNKERLLQICDKVNHIIHPKNGKESTR